MNVSGTLLKVELEDLDSVSSGLSGVGFSLTAHAAAICAFERIHLM